ncbi:hypothetical protein QA596_12590 [Balneolales bacterium ANBcel1]|nr:hypothetical protein [Balneolales bacterium ANBcel1]
MDRNKILPIIYVRGYAGSSGAVESTVDLPYYGFNLGSTKVRAGVDGEPGFSIFESPLIRLMKDYGYVDYFVRCDEGVLELLREQPGDEYPFSSLWVYRYYDITSKIMGEGIRKEIEVLAQNLGTVIDGVLEKTGAPQVYLVAHSMGGLICRSLIQKFWREQAVGKIAKLFTYGTPHNGIHFRKGLNWATVVRDAFGINDSDTFGLRRMKEYLDLSGEEANSLEGRFPVERVFSMIGTNYQDYDVAGGWSRRAVGPGSDGLVQVKNAYVKGSSRAYVYRSHSGPYGIVNSEEGYQNLQRFLFGDTSIQFDLVGVRITDSYPDRDTLRYLLLETRVSIAGEDITMTGQLEEQGSGTVVVPDELAAGSETLFRTYLAKSQRAGSSRYSHLQIEIKIVPKHVRDRKIWRNRRYFGEYLFHKTLTIGVGDPDAQGRRKVRYAWSALDADIEARPGRLLDDGTLDIPLKSHKSDFRWIKSGVLRISVRQE